MSWQQSENTYPYMHQFVRDKAERFCIVCQDKWPASGSIVSKYYVCSVCGVTVHTACRTMAKQCYPCTSIAHKRLSDAEAQDAVCPGMLIVKLLHAYDLPVQSGASVYGVFRLPPYRESVSTSLAGVGEQDVVWDGVALSLEYRPLDHIPSDDPNPNPNPNPPTPILEVEVWKSMFLLLDTQVASAAVSLLPVLLFPNVTVERWFSLSKDGLASGMALLQIVFIPQMNRLVHASKGLSGVPGTLWSKLEQLSQDRSMIGARRASGPAAELSRAVLALTSPESSREEEFFPFQIAQPTSTQTPAHLRIQGQEAPTSGSNSPRRKESFSVLVSSSPLIDTSTVEAHDSRRVVVKTTVQPPSERAAVDLAVRHRPESLRIQLTDAMKSIPSSNQAQPSSDDVQASQSEASSDTMNSGKVNEGFGSNESTSGDLRHRAEDLNPTSKSLADVKDEVMKTDDQALSLGNGAVDNLMGGAASRRLKERFGSMKPKSVFVDKAAKPNENTNTHVSSKSTDVHSTPPPALAAAVTAATEVQQVPAVTSATLFDTALKETMSETVSNCVGRLHIHIISAHKANAKDAGDGEHLVRIEVGDSDFLQVEQTHPVYGSANPIFNRQFCIEVHRFRCPVKLYLCDVHDRKMGVHETSVYALLQRDADQSLPWNKAPLQNVNLKEGDKNVGYMQVKLAFEENIVGLYLSKIPHLCPASPPEIFSVERLQTHIARTRALWDTISTAFKAYKRIMDWEDPYLTGVLLVLFCYIVLTISAEYALSTVMFIPVGWMTWSLLDRKLGIYRRFWVEKNGFRSDTVFTYRPIAYLRVSILSYRNLSTGKGGFPYVKITYLPLGDAHAVAASLSSELLIGCTNTSLKDSRRVNTSGLVKSVTSMLKSDNAKDALLHNVTDMWPRQDGTEDVAFVYPVLQPIDSELSEAVIQSKPQSEKKITSASPKSRSLKSTESFPSKGSDLHAQPKTPKGSSKSGTPAALLQWSTSRGVVKFTVYGNNPFTSFLDTPWGTVTVPMKELISDEKRGGLQMEYRKWLQLQWSDDITEGNNVYHEEDDAALEIRMQLELRDPKKEPSEHEIDASKAIQEMLDRSGDKSQSTISTLWNLRDNVSYVQNVMSRNLDTVESFKNLINWTHARKTLVVYVCVCCTWIAFTIVPGRYLILMAGLYAFFEKFIPVPPEKPFMRKCKNLLNSIPNDDDLRAVYKLEREAFLAQKRSVEKQKQRHAKLHLVFSCQWQGNVRLKASYTSHTHTHTQSWAERYLAVQSHRLVWWKQEDDVEDGKSPEGQLLLSGHAGCTHASPVEVREVGDPSKLVCVFGKDPRGSQMKLTVVCASPSDKEELVRVVTNAVGKQD